MVCICMHVRYICHTEIPGHPLGSLSISTESAVIQHSQHSARGPIFCQHDRTMDHLSAAATGRMTMFFLNTERAGKGNRIPNIPRIESLEERLIRVWYGLSPSFTQKDWKIWKMTFPLVPCQLKIRLPLQSWGNQVLMEKLCLPQGFIGSTKPWGHVFGFPSSSATFLRLIWPISNLKWVRAV